MDIALDKVCELILRVRAIDVKEGITDPASGSNPIDDGSIDALTDPDDATEEELRDVIAGLNDDERADSIAMVYIGRGDMEPKNGAPRCVSPASGRPPARSLPPTGSSASRTLPISSTRASTPWGAAAPDGGGAPDVRRAAAPSLHGLRHRGDVAHIALDA